MNILLLEKDLSCWGGSEAMAFAVAKGLAARGHSVFLAYETEGSLLQENSAIFRNIQKVRLQPFGWRMLLSSLRTALTLQRLAKQWKADVIFTSHRGFLRTLALVKVLWKIPFIYHFGLESPLSTVINRWALKQMAAGVAPSRKTGGSWVRTGLPQERLHIVPNWIDFERFAPVADKLGQQHQLKLPSETPVIVFVGRVVPEKGVEILIRAFAKICKPFPKAVLLLVGGADDSYAARINTLCSELGLSDKEVRQIGRSSTPELYLAAADIAVVPSIEAESFGLTAVEAMACGTLTIVSSAGELAAVMGTENEDLVFPRGDTEALARMLKAWVVDPRIAAQRGLRLRDYALMHFQAPDKIARYENIMKAVCKSLDR